MLQPSEFQTVIAQETQDVEMERTAAVSRPLIVIYLCMHVSQFQGLSVSLCACSGRVVTCSTLQDHESEKSESDDDEVCHATSLIVSATVTCGDGRTWTRGGLGTSPRPQLGIIVYDRSACVSLCFINL